MADPVRTERSLPHNLEAERSVLGAILSTTRPSTRPPKSSPRAISTATRIVASTEDGGAVERGAAIDLVTLKDDLARSGELDEVGGPAYIASLVDGVPRSTNVDSYARIIKEKSSLRELIFSANKILANAYETDQDAAVILDEAEQAIFSIAEDRVRPGFVSMRDLAHQSFEAIEQAVARKQLVTGVPTGFVDLDEMTSGLQPGELIILAARPSMGKTALALNIAQHVGTRTDKTVGVFSLEMSKEQLFLRMLTARPASTATVFARGFSASTTGRSCRPRWDVSPTPASSSMTPQPLRCSRCAPRRAASCSSTACTSFSWTTFS